LTAGRDLRATAEALFGRPVSAIVLTHPHDDHWIGASSFGPESLFLASEVCRAACLPVGEELLEDFQDRSAWEAEIQGMEDRLAIEQDGRMRVSLENGISHTRLVMSEMADYKPRYADLIFTSPIRLHGTKRRAEIRLLGRGHSTDDVAVLLQDDGVAFVGDVGFFDTQPSLSDSDMTAYRKQLQFFLDADFATLVPGHGNVGGRADAERQLAYFDLLEARIGEVIRRGGTLDEAERIDLPAPFADWLAGDMNRFAANVQYVYNCLGGRTPDGA
jgi:glyoxylase-like metal-dependent hydrolase (beta-lactamase superfamily II)